MIEHLVVGVMVALLILFVSSKSLVRIGPTQVGLVGKRWSHRGLPGENPVAFHGEAGYQAELLMPGLKYVLWPLYWVERHDWVQVPAGQIGIVVAQIGAPLDPGTRTAKYTASMGSFTDLPAFLSAGGQKGVQRKLLGPGSLLPLHPVAFLVETKATLFGHPLSEENDDGGVLGIEDRYFDLQVVPSSADQGATDVIGVVTALEGAALESGDIASRLDGFNDIAEGEKASLPDTALIERILSTKNHLHENYQDAQAFLEHGGKVGIQHDPLLPGSYAVNPFIFRIALAPMLVVQQGQVAVIKSYVGLPTEDTAGDSFKFGCLVKPGHRGVWQTAVGTGKYAVNPHCYAYEIVPTAILTLEWSRAEASAHEIDRNLSPIVAKSIEGFQFAIDLHVQIHVPIDNAPRVISMIGTMQNLVDEILQAAVGNHFRAKLQALTAVQFIQERREVQEDAFKHIAEKLSAYEVETRGVYIQDVVMPAEITDVLKSRLVAAQEQETFKAQELAEVARQSAERAKGVADQQADLAKSEVGMTIAANEATAKKSKADGDATYTLRTSAAEGLGKAEGYAKQVEALGQTGTAIVNALANVKEGTQIVPGIVVSGGGSNGAGLLDAVLARFALNGKSEKPTQHE